MAKSSQALRWEENARLVESGVVATNKEADALRSKLIAEGGSVAQYLDNRGKRSSVATEAPPPSANGHLDITPDSLLRHLQVLQKAREAVEACGGDVGLAHQVLDLPS